MVRFSGVESARYRGLPKPRHSTVACPLLVPPSPPHRPVSVKRRRAPDLSPPPVKRARTRGQLKALAEETNRCHAVVPSVSAKSIDLTCAESVPESDEEVDSSSSETRVSMAVRSKSPPSATTSPESSSSPSESNSPPSATSPTESSHSEHESLPAHEPSPPENVYESESASDSLSEEWNWQFPSADSLDVSLMSFIKGRNKLPYDPLDPRSKYRFEISRIEATNPSQSEPPFPPLSQRFLHSATMHPVAVTSGSEKTLPFPSLIYQVLQYQREVPVFPHEVPESVKPYKAVPKSGMGRRQHPVPGHVYGVSLVADLRKQAQVLLDIAARIEAQAAVAGGSEQGADAEAEGETDGGNEAEESRSQSF
ncbi:unnamed protein product [Arabis nemorensis]|uniref:Uncharacterized protein n=1 Tax=Arabis nemorensis TaxID=586526 RepID=A0A565CM64_9BRAS|nr:unnamed protein product [Arabis nemorensis]